MRRFPKNGQDGGEFEENSPSCWESYHKKVPNLRVPIRKKHMNHSFVMFIQHSTEIYLHLYPCYSFGLPQNR